MCIFTRYDNGSSEGSLYGCWRALQKLQATQHNFNHKRLPHTLCKEGSDQTWRHFLDWVYPLSLAAWLPWPVRDVWVISLCEKAIPSNYSTISDLSKDELSMLANIASTIMLQLVSRFCGILFLLISSKHTSWRVFRTYHKNYWRKHTLVLFRLIWITHPELCSMSFSPRSESQ